MYVYSVEINSNKIKVIQLSQFGTVQFFYCTVLNHNKHVDCKIVQIIHDLNCNAVTSESDIQYVILSSNESFSKIKKNIIQLKSYETNEGFIKSMFSIKTHI